MTGLMAPSPAKGPNLLWFWIGSSDPFLILSDLTICLVILCFVFVCCCRCAICFSEDDLLDVEFYCFACFGSVLVAMITLELSVIS